MQLLRAGSTILLCKVQVFQHSEKKSHYCYTIKY